MMNKKQSSYRSMWKYALMLPVVAMLLLLNSSFQTKAEPVNEMNAVQQNQAPAQDNPQIFSHAEVMPSYPGGEKALLKWLADSVKYPPEAQEKGIQGRVAVRFVITPDGSVENVEVMKGLDPLCDKEAIRVVKAMPKWIPGKQNGKQVYVYYSLPIYFMLQDSANPAKPSSPSQPNELLVVGYGTKKSQSATNSSQSDIATVNLSNMLNVIVEIDGKVVSAEEWKNFDTKNIEAITFKKDVTPNRILITTKKE